MKINIEEQLVKYGYLPEQLPPIFSSEKFFENYRNLLDIPQKNACECVSFTISKNDLSRRNIKIPNPAKQIHLFNYVLSMHKELENRFSNNRHSLSNPFYYLGEIYEDISVFNVPLFREKKPKIVKSTYIKNLKDKMNESMGYKYCYKLDLANFYDSIYTHSIEWAVIGREEAKRNIRVKNDNLGKSLDELVRGTNSNETSGIPTGPFTSRIISELLLVKINEELEDLSKIHSIDFKFMHYVDDYEFYFRSEYDVHKLKNKIIEIFESYRLKINENKSQLLLYPYHSIRDVKSEYDYYIEKYNTKKDEHSLRLLFFKADELTSLGEKGAYKYLYKMLYNRVDLRNCWTAIEPFLIGHLLIRPSISQNIVELILKYMDLVSERLSKEIFKNLEISMNNHLHNESQWLLWSLIKINYDFTVFELEHLYKKCDDDITKIILLSIIYKSGKDSEEKLSSLLKEEIEHLTTFNFESDKWLLLHEWYMNKWQCYKKLEPHYNRNKFFQALKKNKVSFLLI